MALPKAVSLLKSSKRVKFDETVEIHMSLGVGAACASDQYWSAAPLPLPHGVGKTVRVVVFCQGDNVGKAKEAGADFAGADDLLEKIQKQNWLEFDVALATQDLMGKVSRLGKVLGPRGLMPTPKGGGPALGGQGSRSRTSRPARLSVRTDKGGNVHAGVSRSSASRKTRSPPTSPPSSRRSAAKPAGIKGNYVNSITLSSTMGPGIAGEKKKKKKQALSVRPVLPGGEQIENTNLLFHSGRSTCVRSSGGCRSTP